MIRLTVADAAKLLTREYGKDAAREAWNRAIEAEGADRRYWMAVGEYYHYLAAEAAKTCARAEEQVAFEGRGLTVTILVAIAHHHLKIAKGTVDNSN
jgi:hypothetical protein